MSTWLTRITMNTAIETLRAGKRKVFEKSVQPQESAEENVPQLEFLEERPDPERTLSAREQMALVHDALDTLSPYQRQVFELRFFEEKGLHEIADITGRSISSTKTAIFRARAHVLSQVAVASGRADIASADFAQ